MFHKREFNKIRIKINQTRSSKWHYSKLALIWMFWCRLETKYFHKSQANNWPKVAIQSSRRSLSPSFFTPSTLIKVATRNENYIFLFSILLDCWVRINISLKSFSPAKNSNINRKEKTFVLERVNNKELRDIFTRLLVSHSHTLGDENDDDQPFYGSLMCEVY